MKRRRILAFLSGFLATLLLAIGFKVLIPVPAKAQSTTLLIGAAASLQNALQQLDPLFESANRGITVNYNFAASGPLQQQIEQGAPIDLFISAANKQMDTLQQKNLIVTDTRRNLLTNSLVLVVPSNSTLQLTNFRQLTDSNIKKISVGEPRSVPAGQYAEEVFKNLGILAQVQPKLVYGNSVRNVLGSVESGNADAGIVYATDAKISNQVKQVATAPSNLHSAIVYPMAVITASRNQQAARTYAQFLTSGQAQAVFRQYGFGIAR
ncbi:molybdate ABC transporter substrate-binding protein [Planktothrix sp. FACHB-1355]|uniref:Molybdate ABC transporter substrate-binding protein n=1 Tax=Aerosakkonema funiforme FACHB-1375 TaxID=2949571 RepID=A0A926VL20_9CYAN|nr:MULTISPECIES: molybdate ABC transporter substrate-binding protein [Oscillatoriales]MBD2185668.1 molybdate ABC transporter substrate-binding protein [Aerosakkonema funiforme FACHB-1375]MBD3557713.1 molybdate ABC transporter substrate-binding protein [Planktothrix sp. FACHB-1355]